MPGEAPAVSKTPATGNAPPATPNPASEGSLVVTDEEPSMLSSRRIDPETEFVYLAKLSDEVRVIRYSGGVDLYPPTDVRFTPAGLADFARYRPLEANGLRVRLSKFQPVLLELAAFDCRTERQAAALARKLFQS